MGLSQSYGNVESRFVSAAREGMPACFGEAVPHSGELFLEERP